MKKILISLLLLCTPLITHAVPVSWDGNSGTGILQPLQSLWSALVKGDRFQATSTTQASIFPFASTTVTSASGLCLGTDCRTVWPTSGVGNIGNVATSSQETAAQIPFYTSTNGTPALISGGSSALTFDGTRLTATYASTTAQSTTGSAYFATGAGGVAIGTTTLTSTIALDIGNSANTGIGARVLNSNSGSATFSQLIAANDYGLGVTGGFGRILTLGTNFTTTGRYIADSTLFEAGSGLAGGLGIATVGAAPIYFYTTAIERMRILSGGNVGIGSSTPWGLLSVNPNSLGSGVPEFVVGSTTITHFVVTGGGNIGISTTTPEETLMLSGTGSKFGFGGSTANNSAPTTNYYPIIYSTGSGGTFPFNQQGNFVFQSRSDLSRGLYFITGTTPLIRLAVSSGGLVGVGTTTPSSLFSVHGDSLFSGTLSSANIVATGTVTIKSLASAAGSFLAADTTGVVIATTTPGPGMFGIGTGQWTRFNTSGVRPATSSDTVLVGATATTSSQILEVIGGGYFSTNLSVGSTSPWAMVSIHHPATGNANPIFAIASSTLTATTTLFVVDNSGDVGIGTTTPYRNISIAGDSGGAAGTVISPTGIVLNDTGNTNTWDLVSPYETIDFSSSDTNSPGIRARIGVTKTAINGSTDRLGFGTHLAGVLTESLSLQTVAAGPQLALGTTTFRGGFIQSLSSTGTNRNQQASNAVASVQINTDQTDLNYSGNDFGTVNSAGTVVITSRITGTNVSHVAGATSGLMSFHTSGSTGVLAEAMTIDSSQLVGINDTTPTARLSITGNVTGNASAAGLALDLISSTLTDNVVASGGSVANFAATRFSAPTFNTTGLDVSIVEAYNFQINQGTAGTNIRNIAGSYGAFVQTGVLASTSIGVAMNLEPPTGASTTVGLQIVAQTSAATGHPLIRLLSRRAGITTGDRVGDIDFATNDTNLGFAGTTTASFAAIATAAHTAATQPTDFVWRTTAAGGTATNTQKMVLTGAGDLGIGTTSPWGLLALNNYSAAASTKNLFVISSSTGAGATSTPFIITSVGNVGVGTTTPPWLLQLSGTRPFLGISDSSAGTNLKHWLFSSQNGELGISTSTDLYATSTRPALSILNRGQVSAYAVQPATTTTITLDWTATPNQVEYQIGASATTISIINATTSQMWGSRKLVWVCNPASTAGALTWAGVNWIGAAPTQTTTASQCDVYSFDVTKATSTTAFKVSGTAGTGFQ